MADIKVRDLTDTSSVTLDNQIMVLTNDAQNQVQNITVENLLTNVLSSDNGNVLEQGTDGKLYVETPENITGDLADLDTVNKTSLVNSINEVVSNLSTEATTRANADNNLQSQIDAITSASDVTDIVGTYAQLQAYDTTGLPDNSIIKVLQDESRQDETTYYRWVITGGVGAWVLIGEEGPYYTKSQADSLFATRQTTGNLASLDTSDKTSLVNAINELSSVLDPTQTADYINNSKAVESGAISSNSIILSDVIKYAHSTFDPSKFTVVGSPTITEDGIASYPSGGYISTNFALSNLYNKKWTIKTRIIYKSINNDGSIGVALHNDDSPTHWLMKGNLSVSNKTGGIWFSGQTVGGSEGLRIQFSSSSTNIQEGDIVDLELSFDLTTYTLKAVINEDRIFTGSWTPTTEDKNLTGTTGAISANYINLLCRTGDGYAPPANSQIDLKQFSVTVDGVPVFSGNKTGIDTIKPDDYTVVGTPTISADGVASGFSSGNYIQIEDYFANKSTFKGTLVISTPDPSTQTGSGFTGILTSKTVRGFELVYFQPRQKIDIYISSDGAGWDIASARNIINILPNKTYKINFEKTLTNYYFEAIDVETGNTVDAITINDSRNVTATTGITFIGSAREFLVNEFYKGSIDLNSIHFYDANGNLVYQPCLKIPYTEGSEQYGGKYVNAQYLGRVKDAYEQGLANDYFTLDEANGTYTLPMGNLYGMIEKLNQLAKDEIGLPKATFSNTLNDNEIWLEGAEVSKLTYSKLYAIYGDDYGTPTDSANFVLPDCRDRVMQGIGSGGTFGYISAGLPNIMGSADPYTTNSNASIGIRNTSGALYSSKTGSVISRAETNSGQPIILNIDASRSSSIYGNSTTVQPPAIKVRFKTRFQ